MKRPDRNQISPEVVAPPQETHITRAYRLAGVPFNDNKVCRYTGLDIWSFPQPCEAVPGVWPVPWVMMLFRSDGFLMRVRQPTAHEIGWIVDNPETYAERERKFSTWLAGTRYGKPPGS